MSKKVRSIRLSSSIIGGKRMTIDTDAGTGQELVDFLRTYDHDQYGTQEFSWTKHTMQMSHTSVSQGTVVAPETPLPFEGLLGITITPFDNKNGK